MNRSIKQPLADLKRLVFEDIPNAGPVRRNVAKTIRILYYSIVDYKKDNLPIRASALTFLTLLSIVPVFAMAFGIAKGFGLEAYLEKVILENFSNQQEVTQQLLSFSHNMLESTRGGLIAGIGLIILLYTVLQLLTNIEESFNAIWQVPKSRTFIRKFTDYMAIMIVSPIFIVLSSSATVYAKVLVEELANSFRILGFLDELYIIFFQFLPYLSIWILFTLVFMVMPNTRVRFKSALIAGVLSGTMYQAVQWVYITFQIGVSKYNAVYGSFAALPLFLVWLQLSWLIILIGSEVAFHIQNVDSFDIREKTRTLSLRQKKLLSLLFVHRLVVNFKEGTKGLSLKELSAELYLPYNLALEIIENLVNAGIVSEIVGKIKEENLYQPAQDISRLSPQLIISKIENLNESPVEVRYEKVRDLLESVLLAFEKRLEEAPENKPLSSISVV